MEEICENELSQTSYIESKSVVDDSWVHEKDKIDLLKYIKTLYSNKFTWADNTLLKCLITKHYNDTILNMNKEDYLREKEEETTADLIERL